ncbi:MAG: nucleotide pyrophosphohydrolase [Pirellulaceae bacterium]|nr:nucleotide pyrophosphohydrolase [Pirellulaceae bacterium]
MADSTTSVEQLKELVRHFVNQRRWKEFHTPKNLATSIMIEAAELSEHFQWLTPEESLSQAANTAPDSPIAEELSDVLSYVLAMANVLDIDLDDALRLKMAKNALKYPLPPE